MGRLKDFQSIPEDRFISDWTVHDLAERSLHLAAESMLDLSNHLISDRGLRIPETYRDTFQILREAGLMEPGLSQRLEGWAGFRNVLVHLYLDLDHARTYRVIQTELTDLEEFLEWAASF